MYTYIHICIYVCVHINTYVRLNDGKSYLYERLSNGRSMIKINYI